MKTVKALLSKDGLSSLQRPRFRPGLLLEDEDLNASVDYAREMMRLMFRSLFGCGVVCGLDVEAELICRRRELAVTVGRGLALDCDGNPIHVAKSMTFHFDPECEQLPDWIWVTVCYTEKCCRPRDVSCSPDEDGRVAHTRIHDGFEIKLYGEQPDGVCSCEAPKGNGADAARGECCGEADVPATGAGGAPSVGEAIDTCKCYKDHNDGVCACECACRCVVIGKIKTTAAKDGNPLNAEEYTDVELLVSGKVRRSIRPLLTGFLPCIELKTSGSTG